MSPLPPWLLSTLPRLPQLPPWLSSLPGWQQRRRALAVLALGAMVMLLRPYGPVVLLPGWLVGAMLLWGVWELLCWAWWPRRWR